MDGVCRAWCQLSVKYDRQTMKIGKNIIILFTLLTIPPAVAFAQPPNGRSDFASQQQQARELQQSRRSLTGAFSSTSLTCMTLSSVSSALQTGPYGVLALTGVASSVVIPLTLFRQAYSFSVGYGLSVFAMGLSLYNQFNIGISNAPLSLLATAVMFYGARLGSYLLIREWTVESKRDQLKTFDKTPRLKRIPMAIAVSMFYAFMTSPLMYAARSTLESNAVMKFGVGMTWFGAIMEAVTDTQKFFAKRGAKDEETFVGPTEGFYKLCRHPNYLGELIFWFGLVIAGVPSFQKSPIAWGCSVMGFYGIYGIMTNAAKRLDQKQEDKYGGQEKYDLYRKSVPSCLWPFVSL